MISLDFLVGTLLVIAAAPFLTFSWFAFKRLPLLVGIIMLAEAVGGRADIVRSIIVFLLMLVLVIAIGTAGSMMLAKGVLLWLS